MENTVTINKGVNVVAFYFKNAGRHLSCFPKRIEWQGRRVDFSENGVVQPIQKGEKRVQMFEMTDGSRGYQLEFDDQTNNWTLLSVANAS